MVGTVYVSNNGRIVFRTSYDPEFINEVKAINGRKYDPKTREWSVPGTESTKCLELAEKFSLNIDSKVYEIVGKHKETLDLSKSVDASIPHIDIPKLTMELRPYQITGIQYILNQRNTILADEMGTGKTLQSIASVVKSEKLPCLVISPAGLKFNWKREISRYFNNEISCGVLGVEKNGKREEEVQKASECDVIIVNYDILTKLMPLMVKHNICSKIRSVICDEAHYLKNPKSQRTKAVNEIISGMREKHKDDCMIILATGTPVVNRPKDLISLLTILDKFKDFGGWFGFTKRYCGAYRDRFGYNIDGATNLEELEQKLRSMCYIRRTKDQVLYELPDKERVTVFIEPNDLDDKFWTDYNELQAQGYTALKKYLELEEHHEDEKDDESFQSAEAIVRINMLRQFIGHYKIDKVVDFVTNLVESGGNVIVFAIHKEVQNKIYENLCDALGRDFVAQIAGDMSAVERERAVEMFQNGPAKVIVCSQKAAGVGLTLTKASYVVFAEYDWTSVSHDQAEDRAHRIGQKNAVTIYYFHFVNTLDDDIKSLIDSKREIIEKISGDFDLDRKIKKKTSDLKEIFKSMSKRLAFSPS